MFHVVDRLGEGEKTPLAFIEREGRCSLPPSGSCRDYIGVILGIIEKNMETTKLENHMEENMENKMEGLSTSPAENPSMVQHRYRPQSGV